MNLKEYLAKLSPHPVEVEAEARAKVRDRYHVPEPPKRLESRDFDMQDHEPNMEAWKQFAEGADAGTD